MSRCPQQINFRFREGKGKKGGTKQRKISLCSNQKSARKAKTKEQIIKLSLYILYELGGGEIKKGRKVVLFVVVVVVNNVSQQIKPFDTVIEIFKSAQICNSEHMTAIY